MGIFYTAVNYVPSPTSELDCPLIEQSARLNGCLDYIDVSKVVSKGRTIP